MTATTRKIVRISVNCTSSTEARTVSVRSARMETSRPWGSVALSWGKSALTRSATSMTFAPGWRWTLRMMARRLPAQPASWAFSTPSTTSATSRRRIGAPLRYARISGRNCPALKSWSSVASA